MILGHGFPEVIEAVEEQLGKGTTFFANNTKGIERSTKLPMKLPNNKFIPINFGNKYNILNLYLVTSRIEGGPQAILECAQTRTPLLSTNVGVAPEILHEESIYEVDNFENAKVNIEYAYEKSMRYTIPEGMSVYRSMMELIYES